MKNTHHFNLHFMNSFSCQSWSYRIPRCMQQYAWNFQKCTSEKCWNFSLTFWRWSASNWYCLPVDVDGTGRVVRMCVRGTQHLSWRLGHLKDLEAPTWTIKDTRTSCFPSSYSTMLPKYHLWSYTEAMYCPGLYCCILGCSSDPWTKVPVVSASDELL